MKRIFGYLFPFLLVFLVMGGFSLYLQHQQAQYYNDLHQTLPKINLEEKSLITDQDLKEYTQIYQDNLDAVVNRKKQWDALGVKP